MPVFYQLLFSCVKGSSKQMSDSKKRGLISVMCKIMNIRNQNLNAYQKVNGLSLLTSGTSKRAIGRLSQLYDTVSYSTLSGILDICAEKSKRLMAEWAAETVIQAGDNLDIRSQARFENEGVSFHDIHLYNNLLYKSRIPVHHLSDDIPDVCLDDVDYGSFILNEEEDKKLVDMMTYHIKKS